MLSIQTFSVLGVKIIVKRNDSLMTFDGSINIIVSSMGSAMRWSSEATKASVLQTR